MLCLPMLMISPQIVYLGSKEMAFLEGRHKDASIHLNISQDYFSNNQDVGIDRHVFLLKLLIIFLMYFLAHDY